MLQPALRLPLVWNLSMFSSISLKYNGYNYSKKIYRMDNGYIGKIVVRLIAGSSFFAIALMSTTLHAQNITRKLNNGLSRMNMSFMMPHDYAELDSGFYFTCGDGRLSPPIMYTIMKKDSSVKIGITFVARPSDVELNRIRRFVGNRFIPDSSYIYNARGLADTVHHKIKFYSKDYVRRYYNGDNGVEIFRHCVMPVDKIYKHNKIVIISKNGRGHVEITYLFIDVISEKEIDKEIINTAGMLRFNN